jgi:hypothetical protein
MSKEQQELLDEAYKNYLRDLMRDNVSKDDPNYILLSKEEFINKCKTNPEFSQKWGLKIEEKELRHKERIKMAWTIFSPDRKDENVPDWWNVKTLTMDEKNIPTKLITITYDNETIESYE